MRAPRKLKNDFYYLLARLVYWLGNRLPRGVGLVLFGIFGAIGWLVPSREKRRTVQHLTMVLSDRLTKQEIRRTARAVFVNLGKNLFDALHLLGVSDAEFDRLVSHTDLSAVRAAYALGHGVVLITGHIGCFEMLLPFFARKGIKHFAVGRRVYDSRIDEMIKSARNGADFEYLHRTENPRAIIRRLINEGKAFGVLVDQDTSVDGVFAHFLGRPAYSPSGPLRIALRYDIPTFVMFTARQPDNTHRVIISDRLVFEKSGDPGADLVRAVEQANAVLSKAILDYPEQWVWMHRRWRRKPEAEGQRPDTRAAEVGSRKSDKCK